MLLTKPKKRLGVDICNTLAEVNYEIGNIFKIPKWNPMTYSLESLGISKDHTDRFFVEHPEVFALARPLDGAREALHNLAQNWEIFYITSRPTWAQDITLRWLKKYGFPFGTLVMGLPKQKAAQELDIVAFIEDDPTQIQVLQKTCPVYSPKWAYNSGLTWPEIEARLVRI